MNPVQQELHVRLHWSGQRHTHTADGTLALYFNEPASYTPHTHPDLPLDREGAWLAEGARVELPDGRPGRLVSMDTAKLHPGTGIVRTSEGTMELHELNDLLATPGRGPLPWEQDLTITIQGGN